MANLNLNSFMKITKPAQGMGKFPVIHSQFSKRRSQDSERHPEIKLTHFFSKFWFFQAHHLLCTKPCKVCITF